MNKNNQIETLSRRIFNWILKAVIIVIAILGLAFAKVIGKELLSFLEPLEQSQPASSKPSWRMQILGGMSIKLPQPVTITDINLADYTYLATNEMLISGETGTVTTDLLQVQIGRVLLKRNTQFEITTYASNTVSKLEKTLKAKATVSRFGITQVSSLEGILAELKIEYQQNSKPIPYCIDFIMVATDLNIYTVTCLYEDGNELAKSEARRVLDSISFQEQPISRLERIINENIKYVPFFKSASESSAKGEPRLFDHKVLLEQQLNMPTGKAIITYKSLPIDLDSEKDIGWQLFHWNDLPPDMNITSQGLEELGSESKRTGFQSALEGIEAWQQYDTWKVLVAMFQHPTYHKYNQLEVDVFNESFTEDIYGNILTNIEKIVSLTMSRNDYNKINPIRFKSSTRPTSRNSTSYYSSTPAKRPVRSTSAMWNHSAKAGNAPNGTS